MTFIVQKFWVCVRFSMDDQFWHMFTDSFLWKDVAYCIPWYLKNWSWWIDWRYFVFSNFFSENRKLQFIFKSEKRVWNQILNKDEKKSFLVDKHSGRGNFPIANNQQFKMNFSSWQIFCCLYLHDHNIFLRHWIFRIKGALLIQFDEDTGTIFWNHMYSRDIPSLKPKRFLIKSAFH